MKPLTDLRRMLAQRADSEHEQAILRIVIVGLFLGYMATFHGMPSLWTSDQARIVAILAGFLAVATALFVAICISPAPNVTRRLLGMVADVAGCTWYMAVAGDYGFLVIGVLLFVTFGNGFRFGLRYLFGCQLLCLAGLIGVLAFVPYWRERPVPGAGLLVAMLVLPLYVSTLLKRIQEARARAEEANLAKTTFLANMSHEMRTPLNGIVGVVDLMRTTALSVQQTELVGLLRHSITVLRSLVDDVLDISKIEAGHLTIEVAAFDLHTCINGLVNLLRPHAQAKGLALSAMMDPALEYRVKGDPHHLRQVLLNLLGNAIKFTERGEVSLAVSLKRETPEGVTARFEVRDTGIGIAPGAISRIFDRFVQADQSTTRKYGGTGLGTTIAKQLTELMGGNIGVTSTLGEGSTFWIELPFLHDDPVPATVADSQPQATPEPVPGGLTLVYGGARSPQLVSTLESIGEHCETVPLSISMGARLDELAAAGVVIRAVVAACPVEQACAAFSAATQRVGERPIALVYIADDGISVVDRARITSIRGAYALDYPSARLLANAIHAATAGAEIDDPARPDLARVLESRRKALTILVAEDNATNQAIIRQLLERAGHKVLLAADGEQALDLYERQRPDLAILDFNMPHRSGVEVVRAIRIMEPPGERTPVVILSASVTAESRRLAESAGADGYIGKPFDAVALIQQIDRLAAGHRVPIAPKVVAQPAPRATPAANFDPALIDASRVAQLEDIARDPGFLAELIRGFTSDVESLLVRTSDALDAGDVEALPDLMHTLKGAAVSVGAVRLAALTREFDAHVDAGSVQETQAAYAELRACFDATASSLREYLRVQHHASI
ncbi:MAG TPA: ATP-binding protein [Casimicrobiaceae bacterium]|nr:ATP-binding protein [Casimicrobiaceae bacterium]